MGAIQRGYVGGEVEKWATQCNAIADAAILGFEWGGLESTFVIKLCPPLREKNTRIPVSTKSPC